LPHEHDIFPGGLSHSSAEIYFVGIGADHKFYHHDRMKTVSASAGIFGEKSFQAYFIGGRGNDPDHIIQRDWAFQINWQTKLILIML